MVVVNQTEPYNQAAAESAKRKYLGVLMICRTNQGRYRNLVEELQNDFAKGKDNFPTNKTEVYNLLVNYKNPYKN